jgi:hypothetical protein
MAREKPGPAQPSFTTGSLIRIGAGDAITMQPPADHEWMIAPRLASSSELVAAC